MDLPKKRSSRYLSGVYVFFIILFVFTLLLFYISRCQEPPLPIQQDGDPPRSEEIIEKNQSVTKKNGDNKGQSPNKSDVAGPPDGISNKTGEPPVLTQDSSDKPQNLTEDSKMPAGQGAVPSPSPDKRPSPVSAAEEKGIIYFSTDSTGLTDQALEKLKAIYLLLLKNPDDVITIKGYGDSSPNLRHNQKLSQLRANIVKSYFVKRGVSDARLKVSWLNSENAPAGEALEEDGGKTHQVEVHFNLKSKGSLKD